MAVTSSNNLKKGMKDTNGSTDILELQKALNAAGKYNLALDGSFGGKTEAAVKDFQQRNGLKVDGIVGTNTWGKLTGASTGSSNTASTPTAPSVQTSESTNSAYDKWQEWETQKPGAFTYEIPQSSYWSYIQDTIDKINNREPFSYDLNGDALYQQYKGQYTTQGQMAMMDTMGQAAAATGGYGNSYAQSVGQQAYQGYLQQLNDKVPELYQLALNQYNQEYQDLKDLYALYADMDDREYNRAWDKINMDYTLHSAENDEWWKQNESYKDDYWTNFGWDYTTGRDAVTDKNTAYDQAIGMIGAGLMPNSALLSAAGISTAEAQDWVKEVKEQAAASASSGSSGSGGSGSGSGSGGSGSGSGSGGSGSGSGSGNGNNGGGVVDVEAAIKKLKIHPEEQHDAIMRDMYGSYEQYLAETIYYSDLTEDEKIALINYYKYDKPGQKYNLSKDIVFKPKKNIGG